MSPSSRTDGQTQSSNLPSSAGDARYVRVMVPQFFLSGGLTPSRE